MKLLGIILAGIVFLAYATILTSVIWFMPKSAEFNTYTVIACLNGLLAGKVASDKAEEFYEWFKSHTR